MSNFLIAFLAALGATVWIYSKMMKSTGGITKNAIIVSGIIGFIIFIFLITIINMIS